MLVALDPVGERVVGEDAERGVEYACPECHAGLTLKAGAVVTWHFAHRPEADCPMSEGESLRHLEMKWQVGQLLKSRTFEVPLLPGHRADLVLTGRLVVECQASPLNVGEWRTRVADYNAAGYAVLWIWDRRRLGGANDDGECRIPAEMRVCHKLSFGRLYVLDEVGQLMACHLDRALTRYSNWHEGATERTPKTIRIPRFKNTPLRPHRLVGPEGHVLGELGEGVWWKTVYHTGEVTT